MREYKKNLPLPLFLRRVIAFVIAWYAPEYTGIIAKWRKDDFDIAHEWRTDKGAEEAWAVVENSMCSGRDEIFVALICQGWNKGYFCIHAGERWIPMIGFWDGVLTFDEALVIVKRKCNQIAKEMGYAVEDSNGQN